MPFELNHELEGDILYIKAKGFDQSAQVTRSIRDKVLELLKSFNGKPFKVLFDLRGLKPVPPDALKMIEEIDDFLCDSSSTKIGTVFDNAIVKGQHLRTAEQSKGGVDLFNDGRSKIFDDIDICRAWLRA